MTDGWDFSKIKTQLPPTVKSALINTNIVLSDRTDIYFWKASSGGKFSSKEAYMFLRDSNSSRQQGTTRWVWL
ncbi:hypothetical protein OROGR_001634 [Orobanche gracilis]